KTKPLRTKRSGEATHKGSGPTCATNTKPTLYHQPSTERLTIMARHTSATSRSKKSQKNQSNNIDASLKRRARLLIINSSIPKQTRTLIRYALEIKDQHLAQVVRRVESGEMTIDYLYLE